MNERSVWDQWLLDYSYIHHNEAIEKLFDLVHKKYVISDGLHMDMNRRR